MRILPLQKLLSLIVMLCATVMVFAQPANDDCSTPTLLVVGADAASCTAVAGDTRGTVDATTIAGPEVCSGSWYTDDVWFSFETGATAPQFGVTVEVSLDPSSGTELMEQGMAIYTDCEATSMPIDCFSDEPGRRTITFPGQCLEPNSTYLIRLWSAPDPITNSGTFSICAYEAEEDTSGGGGGGPSDRIIYEETFDKGMNGWTSVAETMTEVDGEMLADDWMWSNNGCVPSAFGGSECLTRADLACQEVGVVGIPAGWYQTFRTGDVSTLGGPPYADKRAYLVSPPIDLSKEACVNLTWIESHRGLNGSGVSRFGPLVQYSLDGGETWINPSQAIGSADVSTNYGGTYVVNAGQNAVERRTPLIGAEGNTDVRLRFGFDGDFYYWIIDDIRLVEGTAADAIAQANFYARSHINPMSVHQVDSYDFLVDIANLACEDQTNLNVNVTGVNSAGDEVHNVNLGYGTIQSDSLAENQSFLQPFTPTTDVDSYEFTYTVTSDLDEDLTNNVRSFGLEVVDETMFRKEDGTATGGLTPNTAEDVFWAAGEPFAWEMGAMFYAPNATALTGEQLRFNEISFQLGDGNAAEILGELLRIWLYKIEDNDFDGIIDKDDSSEITRLGISEYTVTGVENGFITVAIESFLGNPDDLNIEAGTHYMAAIESTTELANGMAMQIADSDAYDYSAAAFNARQNANNDLSRIRYTHAFGISKENYLRIIPSTTGDLTTGNFGEDSTPLIRLSYVAGGVSTTEINNNIDISIAPNPASNNITVDLSIEEATDMEVSVVSLTGQVIMTKSFDKVNELRENFDVSSLASGIYMIHIDTNEGVQTKKFVVSK